MIEHAEIFEAARAFVEVFSQGTAHDIAASLTCDEFDALYDLMIAGGMSDADAETLIEAHREDDGCEADHPPEGDDTWRAYRGLAGGPP